MLSLHRYVAKRLDRLDVRNVLIVLIAEDSALDDYAPIAQTPEQYVDLLAHDSQSVIYELAQN